MTKKHAFTAVIKNAGGGGAFVEIPFDVEQAFGSKKPKVKASIEGIPYRGTLVRMGSECHMLIILKGIREQAGKTFGHRIKVSVEADSEPRVVKVPNDLLKEFKKTRRPKPSSSSSPIPINANTRCGSRKPNATRHAGTAWQRRSRC
jgi:hypothetical protein